MAPQIITRKLAAGDDLDAATALLQRFFAENHHALTAYYRKLGFGSEGRMIVWKDLAANTSRK